MQDVTIDRHLYIGGSDISVIMGISPFKTRFDLLLEKAELKENDFDGNEYTEYGNVLEPKIRTYLNETAKTIYLEDKVIKGDCRYHSDGFNGNCVLEIKTTSQIHENVSDYKVYLVQLLFGMQMHEVKKGLLAVYERPKDFSEDFDASRLKTYEIDIKDYKELLEEINKAIEQFRNDLIKVKANPFITEEELQPKELIELSNQVAMFEKQLTMYKVIENQYKELKTKLYEAMTKYNVKKWVTNDGTQITRVLSTEDETTLVDTFNAVKFEEDFPDMYNKYIEKQEQIKKGRAGFVKITLLKE